MSFIVVEGIFFEKHFENTWSESVQKNVQKLTEAQEQERLGLPINYNANSKKNYQNLQSK